MRRGFTLMELSIVIVVIGLLVGALIEGNILIKNARLNSVLTEFDFYNKSVKLFQDRYNALPGDMSNATTVFVDTAGTTLTGVANGDGGGTIVSDYTASPPTEMYSAWIQLSYAELIQGSYTTSANWSLTPGTNIPASSAMRGGGWLVFYVGYRGGADTEFYTGNYGHIMALSRTGYTTSRNGGVLSPSEQYNIDNKYDDGLAQTGIIRSTKNLAAGSGFQSGCLVSDQYTVTSNSVLSCVPVFLTGY